MVMGAEMSERQKQDALAQAAELLGDSTAAARQVLSELWDLTLEQGKLAALDELQDRFCPEDVPAFVELESGGPPPGAFRMVGHG